VLPSGGKITALSGYPGLLNVLPPSLDTAYAIDLFVKKLSA
jgi:hypothetical protein